MKEKNIQELAIRMGLITVEDMCQYTIAQLVVKIANKVNELVDEVWRFETDVQEILKTQNENIQYLLGGGLHLEVENIFDGWVQDGTFDTLINQTALKKVNDRIDETNAQLSQVDSNLHIFMHDYAVGDGSDETLQIQKALNDSIGKKLYWNRNKGDCYYCGQLDIPSNVIIEFESGTKLKAKPLDQQSEPKEVLFNIADKANINILGNHSELCMNKNDYTTSEWNHIVNIVGSENIKLNDLYIHSGGGDGVYIGNNNTSLNKVCKNIEINNCKVYSNSRNNLSICSVDGLTVNDCEFNFADRVNPRCGVDIEPNYSTDVISNVVFNNCKSINNVRDGFRVLLWHLQGSKKPVSVVFNDCYSESDNNGFYCKFMPSDINGFIIFNRCVGNVNEYNAFNFENCSDDGVKIIANECIAINGNVNNDTSVSKRSAFLIGESDLNKPLSFGNIELNNCKSIDNRESSLILRGFHCDVSVPVTNVKIRNFDSVGHTGSARYTGDTAEVKVIDDVKKEMSFTSTGNIGMAIHNGELINNKGATNNIRLTINRAKKGDTIHFRVDESHLMRITSTENVKIVPSSATIIESSEVGAMLSLECYQDGIFNIINKIGTWTETNI